MATLGERLRAEREKQGLTIEELASRTRISARFFEAIERDEPEALPSGFFYRSFVRQYARMMGLPEDSYQREIERSLAEEAGKPYTVPERHIDVPPLPTAQRSFPCRILMRKSPPAVAPAAGNENRARHQRRRVGPAQFAKESRQSSHVGFVGRDSGLP